MADAVVSFAIEKLGDFLVHQVNLRIGVRDDIRWLKEELGFLQASVRRAESRQEDEIRLWISTVRDVANDAVDILKKFRDGQASQLEQGHMDRFLNCICICKKEAHLYDIGNNIESLKKRIGVIKERRVEFGINTILAGPDVKQKERTLIRASAIDKHVDVVGFKEDFDKLMKELNSEDPALKIISIHGMGGLGKTSLATKLYNSNKLRHFGTRAKVCVSSDYTVKDVLKRLVMSFKGPEDDQHISSMDEHRLLQYLSKLFKEESCYLVLIDDIWDINIWNQIMIAFPNQDKGGRIIITTRNKKIAETVSVAKNVLVYQLRFLREEESWELFCKTAEPTQNLENLGREMVGKCRGLPLAIVILGGLLLHNKSYDYWSKVKEHIWRHLSDDSVDIVEILSLSYRDLSFQMKDCFLYLAQFPEDRIIDVELLKHLWIAEEFISEDEGDGLFMEDLAEDCLNELINRNLIQIESLLLNGKVRTCQVHDLVRELAIRKAKEQKLLVIFDSRIHQPNLIRLFEGQRRHAISDRIGEYLKLLEHPKFDSSYLRSLLLQGSDVEVELKKMKWMYTSFINLKVLDMSSIKSERIPEEIGGLVLLKFLGLMGCHNNTVTVPASIGKLKKLQSLWGVPRASYTVPTEIWELPELRHMYQISIKISKRLNIGSHQTKLHSLNGIDLEEWVKIDIVNFTNLRSLSIQDYQGGRGFSLESLAMLTNLQSFSLLLRAGAVIPTMKSRPSLNRLKSIHLTGIIKDPSELCFLPDSVTDLTLCGSALTEDPMPSLGNLPNLTALQLDIGVYGGNKMVCTKNTFPSLQILRLIFLINLEELEVEDGALPCLKSFQALECEELKKIPVQLKRFLT